ncbi:MAG: erythromycin biosynthesis sensory transduction protein eryC1 [Methylococcaceae bacterium]|nr:erythromycin biosynthesis sensory transduction protein eryC1 [Methylococcaceae bacterium]
MIKFLDLRAQYQSIKLEIDHAIQKVIEESSFIGGPYVAKFEKEFSEYTGAKYCIGVANGTDALEIAIESAQLPPGSEIIVPGNSFIASAEAVTRMGHKVVFADIDTGNYTLTKESLLEALSPKTAAVIAVHLYGHPCEMDVIEEVCRQNNLFLLEDCAQAHGAEYKGKKVGAIGDMAAFSFYPGKNLGAYGDGGAITSNNEALSKKARMIANHGRIEKYDHEFEGRNSRLDGLQAAILSVKLNHLDTWTDNRILIANYYLEHLQGIDDFILPVREEWAKQVYHLFVIRCSRRDELKAFLNENGIQCGVHYPKALPKLKAYAYLNQSNQPTFYNNSDASLLSLPIGEHLSLNDAEKVVTTIRMFFH